MEEKYFVMRDRNIMLTPCYWNGVIQTSDKTEEIHGIKADFHWQLFLNGNMRQFYLKKTWDRVNKFTSQRLASDVKYFNFLKKAIPAKEKEADRFVKSFKRIDLAKLNFEELTEQAFAVQKTWLDYDHFNVMPWFWGGDLLLVKLKKETNIPEKDLLTLISNIESSVGQMEYDLAKAVLSKKNVEKTAQKLSDDYGWIPFGYDGPVFWGEDYFIKKISEYGRSARETITKADEEKKRKIYAKNNIIKKYSLDNKQVVLVHIVEALGRWQDERKKVDFKLHYCYSKILWELEKRFKIPYKNLKFLLVDELSDIKKDREKVLEATKYRMNNAFIERASHGVTKILEKTEVDAILRELEAQAPKSNIIKGSVASVGDNTLYKGLVKVVLTASDCEKVVKGDFLVTGMTTPDFVVAMKKAKGFITDEGGVTCHAAIVGREMGKPVIIGTKNATKILKDGDKIEVNTELGTVKVIK